MPKVVMGQSRMNLTTTDLGKPLIAEITYA
jgi:hypothetical protein